MVEKVLEDKYVTLFSDMQKLITNIGKIIIKLMKNYDKNKELSYLQ